MASGWQAFAVFGIEYKAEQVNLICRLFDRVVIVFDSEPQAQRQARKLASGLAAAGTETQVLTLGPGLDPGAMAADDAAALLREVGRWSTSG